eukprot:15483003-Alexandrium_andersonii.AAC.1
MRLQRCCCLRGEPSGERCGTFGIIRSEAFAKRFSEPFEAVLAAEGLWSSRRVPILVTLPQGAIDRTN